MELFSEKDEEAKARQIHYDDAAIDRFDSLLKVAESNLSSFLLFIFQSLSKE